MYGPGPLSLAELCSHIRYLPEDSALARALAAEHGQLPADTTRWIAQMRVLHMLLDVTWRVNTKRHDPAPPLSHFLNHTNPQPPPEPERKPRTMRDWLKALGPWAEGVPPPPDPA